MAEKDNKKQEDGCDEQKDAKSGKHLWKKETRYSHLAQSDIGLAPLPDNRFTRGKCTFKILEYACSGLPVVASPVGVHSDFLLDGESGFLARDNKEWVEKMTTLIEDAPLREKMGCKNRSCAEQLDFSIIGKKFIKLITDCLYTENFRQTGDSAKPDR